MMTGKKEKAKEMIHGSREPIKCRSDDGVRGREFHIGFHGNAVFQGIIFGKRFLNQVKKSALKTKTGWNF